MEYILETLGKVGFDIKMGLFNFVNFLVVFFILKKLFFAKIMAILDERKKLISEGVDNMKIAKSELQMAEQKAKEIINEAKGEKNAIVATAHDEALKAGEELKGKAKEEIGKLISQAKLNIEKDKQQMKDEFRKEATELVIDVTTKILGEKIDGKKDQKLISDSLSSIKE